MDIDVRIQGAVNKGAGIDSHAMPIGQTRVIPALTFPLDRLPVEL
jgi:hypothetical protein